MKIIWLCNVFIPKIANQIGIKSSNFGGWISGLYEDIINLTEYEIVYLAPTIDRKHGIFDRTMVYAFKHNERFNDLFRYFEEIIMQNRPVLIHIFGTEFRHTRIMIEVCKKLGLTSKCIIHIQGLVSVYADHYYSDLPQKVLISPSFIDLIKMNGIINQRRKFINRGIDERYAIKNCDYVLGRTDWDRACTGFIHDGVKYYYCNESLRNSFYTNKWDISKIDRHSIFVSQSTYPIKGFHYLLKAMPFILDKYPNCIIYTTSPNPFMSKGLWSIIKQGTYIKYIKSLIKKNHLHKNVVFLGTLDETQIVQKYLSSHVFVSPSSIENSSNSVGEAMLLGVPIVSSFVGGISSLLTHGNEAFLYQHNAPYMLAYYIMELFRNDKTCLLFSSNARHRAMNTHNRQRNLDALTKIYDLLSK